MKIVVLKFGGTSVGTIRKIKKVAEIIANYKKKKYKVIVVSSAMSGVTNELVNKSLSISNNFSESEYDVLVSSGEQIACSLIAGRLNHLGIKSRSWLSWQVPILTDGDFKKSKKISRNFSESEYDVLVSSGEQIACSLIAGSLIRKGLKSRSW